MFELPDEKMMMIAKAVISLHAAPVLIEYALVRISAEPEDSSNQYQTSDTNVQMLAGVLSPFKDLTPHSLVYFGGLSHSRLFGGFL